jgi:hypothetical protein
MFALEEVRKNIFHLRIDDPVKCGLTALRYSEYYESPKFHRKFFTLMEFIEEWIRNNDGVFAYTRDYSGYNIPDWVFDELMPLTGDSPIQDIQPYDVFMSNIVATIRDTMRLRGDNNFYLVLTSKKSVDATVEHEVSHGFYYLDEDYRNSVNNLCDRFRATYPDSYEAMINVLKDIGYIDDVFHDEIGAYLATGFCKEMVDAEIPTMHGVPATRAEFSHLFKKRWEEG